MAVFAPVVLALLVQCSGGPTEPRDYEFGRADVYVRDEAGQPINGVTVRLERTNGQIEEAGGPTGSLGVPGYYFFLRTSGDFRIGFTVPEGYALAPNQPAAVPFTFRRNQTQTVNITLRKL